MSSAFVLSLRFSQGLVGLGRAVAASSRLILLPLTVFPAASDVASNAVPTNSAPPALAAVPVPAPHAPALPSTGVDTNVGLLLREVMLPLIEQLQVEQRSLRESLARLAPEQERGLERQALHLRQEQRAMNDRLAISLSTQRDQEMDALLELGRSFLVVALAGAALMLLALGVVAWSLLRVVNRIPLSAVSWPRGGPGQDEAGLPILADAHLTGAIEQPSHPTRRPP